VENSRKEASKKRIGSKDAASGLASIGKVKSKAKAERPAATDKPKSVSTDLM